MAKIFSQALSQMNKLESDWSTPQSFQDYAVTNGIKAKNTADHISVQSFKGLAKELRENKTMVFRLGSPLGSRSTYFALARISSSWNEYFLMDEDIFKTASIDNITTNWSSDQFIPFSIISKLTETSFVNLALNARVFEIALGLSTNGISIPATGKSTHSFEVRPNSNLPISWSHESGQVEIDSIFVAHRNGKKMLCIVEAKAGGYPDSLPKHKLVYALLTVAPNVPVDFEIVPIYVRVQMFKQTIRFYIVECSFPDPRSYQPHIDELYPVRSKIIEIEHRHLHQ